MQCPARVFMLELACRSSQEPIIKMFRYFASQLLNTAIIQNSMMRIFNKQILKLKVILQTHFLILALHLTIIYAVKVICVYNTCVVEIPYNSVLLPISSDSLFSYFTTIASRVSPVCPQLLWGVLTTWEFENARNRLDLSHC